MKTILTTMLVCFLTTAAVTAQNNNVETEHGSASILIGKFAGNGRQTGTINYQFCLTESDFNYKQFVFFTDSNATVAYMIINGFSRRLTGGPNAEHILAYSCPGYTVTLSFTNTTQTILMNADDRIGVKSTGQLAVYNDKGQVTGSNVTGMQVNAIKK